MPSGWDVYYVVFLSALLALGIPLLLRAASFLFTSRGPQTEGFGETVRPEYMKRAQGVDKISSQRINVRFFLAANAALVLITLGLVLVPCTSTLHEGNEDMSVLKGLVAIVTIAGFAALGLMYSSRKGDLSWILTHRAAPALSDETKADGSDA